MFTHDALRRLSSNRSINAMASKRQLMLKPQMCHVGKKKQIANGIETNKKKIANPPVANLVFSFFKLFILTFKIHHFNGSKHIQNV